VKIANLPSNTQEGILQQVLEKIMPVSRIEVFLDKQMAVVELKNQAVGLQDAANWGSLTYFLSDLQDVGRVLLRADPITFGGNILEISENIRAKGNVAASSSAPLFKPRNLGPSRPKAGLGSKRTPIVERNAEEPVASASSGGKGQDDFRKLLERK
jgi:hypothetical protein